MIRIVRTDSTDSDFIRLVRALDAELAERDGAEHAFYNQFNKIDSIRYVILVYEDGLPVACGGIKEFDTGILEIKRMFTIPEKRGRGFAGRVLAELEKWAIELSIKKCVLETGKRQPEAIRLYQKSGYRPIPNFGQYAGVENSLCFEKELKVQEAE